MARRAPPFGRLIPPLYRVKTVNGMPPVNTLSAGGQRWRSIIFGAPLSAIIRFVGSRPMRHLIGIVDRIRSAQTAASILIVQPAPKCTIGAVWVFVLQFAGH